MKIPTKTILFILIVLGALYRLDFLYSNNFVIDSDEAIVGLMGKHINEGAEIPTFYYGQHYMGSLEAILASISFRLFGISNFSLKLVPLLFSLLLIPIGYLLGKKICDEQSGLISAFLFAIPSSTLVVWSAKARGGFIEILVIGAISLLFFSSWLKYQKSAWRLYFSALLLGLGWWVNNQIVYFILPVLSFLLLYIFRSSTQKLFLRILKVLSFVIFFIIGSLPYWIYNFKNNFVSLEMFGSAKPKDVTEHFEGVYELALPIILGAKRFWQEQDVFFNSSFFILSFYVLVFIWVLYKRRRQIGKLFLFKISDHHIYELLIFLVIAVVGVFSYSSFGYLSKAPRYLLPIYIGFYPLMAGLLNSFFNVNKLIGSLVLFILLAFNLSSSYLNGRAIPGEPFVYDGQRVSKDHTELLKWLNEKDIDWVRTNYWIGYRLAFETNEKVKFSFFGEPRQDRIKSYTEDFKKEGISNAPLVLVPKQWKLVEEAMKTLGFEYKVKNLSNYKVVYDISSLVADRKEIKDIKLKVSATHQLDQAKFAIDDDINSRWGSGVAQEKDMQFEIELDPVTEVSGLMYDLGKWNSDYPRGFKIAIDYQDGKDMFREVVVNNKYYNSIRYYAEGSPKINFYFKPKLVRRIILTQTGSDKVFDWSIAELKLYN